MKAFLAALAVLFAFPAAAQQCTSADRLDEVLGRQFGEEQRFAGLTSDGAMILQIWVNETTGTWTAVVIRPDGSACLVAEGDAAKVTAAGAPA